jgi:hypothetical protein
MNGDRNGSPIYDCPMCGNVTLKPRPCPRCERMSVPLGWEEQFTKDVYNIVVRRLQTGAGPDPELDADIAFLFCHKETLPYTGYIEAAQQLLPIGFWWQGSSSFYSSDARIGPDYNDPRHRERLLQDYPPELRHWDRGVAVEIRPGGDGALIRALGSVCLAVHSVGPKPRQPVRIMASQ